MSNWTHVAGIIRVNSLRRTGDTEQQAKERMLKIFGKLKGRTYVKLKCPWCGKIFSKEKRNTYLQKNGEEYSCCCRQHVVLFENLKKKDYQEYLKRLDSMFVAEFKCH